MALLRRSGSRFTTNIWPGFVDAMTALLLVLMFVLSIFMIIQSVFREKISGQETELSRLENVPLLKYSNSTESPLPYITKSFIIENSSTDKYPLSFRSFKSYFFLILLIPDMIASIIFFS